MSSTCSWTRYSRLNLIYRCTPTAQCRFMLQVDRTGKKFSIQPVKVAKDYSWKKDILDNIDYCCEEGVVMDITLPTKDKPMRHNWPESKVRLNSEHGVVFSTPGLYKQPRH